MGTVLSGVRQFCNGKLEGAWACTICRIWSGPPSNRAFTKLVVAPLLYNLITAAVFTTVANE